MDEPTGRPMDPEEAEADAEIAALVERGRYHDAASLLAARGEPLRAQLLLEKVWDWAGAASLAERRGDRVGRLRLLVEGKDLAGVAAQLAEIARHGALEERAGAAELCEKRRMWREAASLREGLGEPALARVLYERAAMLLDAGRLDEQLGRYREAGLAYERWLHGLQERRGAEELADHAVDNQVDIPLEGRGRARGGPQKDGAEATTTDRDAARTRGALGRVLAILGRHEDAVRQLQAALRQTPGTLSSDEETAAREQLVVSLAALGMRDGASVVLESLQARRATQTPPSPLATPGDFESLSEFLARRQRDANGDLLAGRYAVERLLGSGGMGRVYLAHDRVTDERVAVKVVAPPADPRVRDGYRRFLREADVVAHLSHPNLVAVREVRASEGLLVMEYMIGGTLEGRLAALPSQISGETSAATKRGLPPRLVKAILTQVVRGLSAAHARGVIHRDIKPANIFLSLTGEAKLGDFGVAHLQDLGATQTAGFIGTLAYMSPEQITAAPLSFACDLYALGVTAFQILTGRLPFEGPDFVGAHLSETAPLPSVVAPRLGTGFDALVARLLAKDPRDRHRSLDELLRALDAIDVVEGGEEAKGAGDRGAPADAAAPAPGSLAARYRVEADLGRTLHSSLHRAVDERLGRAVILERFDADAFEGTAGARRLVWLRAMARHGGPHLQRVLRLDLGARTAVYEGVRGTRTSSVDAAANPSAPAGVTGGSGVMDARGAVDATRAAAALVLEILEALAGPHGEGVAHGDVERALVVEAGGATLTVAGSTGAVPEAPRDPDAPVGAQPDPTAADVDALRAVVARLHGGLDLPRGAVALRRWARAAGDQRLAASSTTK